MGRKWSGERRREHDPSCTRRKAGTAVAFLGSHAVMAQVWGGGGGEGRDVQNQALLLSQALPGVAPQVDLGAGSVSCLLPFLTLSSALQPPEPMTRLGGWWLTDQSRGRKHSFLARQVWLHVPALPLSSSMT